MFDRGQPASMGKQRILFGKILATTLFSTLISVSPTVSLACDKCSQVNQCSQCQTCSSCAAAAPRSKPFSIRQLSSIVESLDRFSDSFEQSLVRRARTSSCSCDIACDTCGNAVNDQTWENYSPSITSKASQAPHSSTDGSVPAQTLPVQPPMPVAPEVGTAPIIELPKFESSQSRSVENPFVDDQGYSQQPKTLIDTKAPDALNVPSAKPEEDYQHDPFKDDVRNGRSQPTMKKVLNRYKSEMPSTDASARATNSAPNMTPRPKTIEEFQSLSARYSHAYQPQQFIDQQKSAEFRTKQLQAAQTAKSNASNVPQTTVATNEQAQNAPREGIRVKVGGKPQEARRALPAAKPAVFESDISNDNAVRPANAIVLPD